MAEERAKSRKKKKTKKKNPDGDAGAGRPGPEDSEVDDQPRVAQPAPTPAEDAISAVAVEAPVVSPDWRSELENR